MRLNLIVLFIFVNFSNASEVIKFTSYDGKTNYEMTKIEQKTISVDCEKNKNCLAIKALDKKELKINSNLKQAGNPASDFCESIGGHDVVLKTSEAKEYDFCTMTDKSMIDSWELYYAHHPKNEYKFN